MDSTGAPCSPFSISSKNQTKNDGAAIPAATVVPLLGKIRLWAKSLQFFSKKGAREVERSDAIDSGQNENTFCKEGEQQFLEFISQEIIWDP